jgi:hypothetical protein
MKNKLIMIAVFSLGFAFRLYQINAPLADWHSFRQADTASVSREFVNHGISLLKPHYHDLSNIQSGKPNPEGYRMVEFPIYNTLHAVLAKFNFPFLNFEGAGRMVSVLASLTTAYFLYLIVKKQINRVTAIFAASFFLFLPFSIFYSRTILPDSLMICLSLASIHFLLNSETSMFNVQKIIGVILGSLALLTKPYALFIIFPCLLFIFLKKINFKNLLSITSYGLLIIIPLIGWRMWIQRFPEGIPVNQWLLNQNNIRLRPAWWRWLFEERIGRLILGSWGLIPFGLGLITKINKKISWYFYLWSLGILTYFVVFAWGNVQHDYYQIITLPLISVFLAKGSYLLLNPPLKFNKYLSYILFIVSCSFAFGFSWYQVREYYKINHPEIIAAGKAADKLLPKEAKVIAPYQGDTAFLYQTKRRGWPAVTRDVSQLVEMGADYYVSVNFDKTTANLKNKCPVLDNNESWIIINLKECQNLK